MSTRAPHQIPPPDPPPAGPPTPPLPAPARYTHLHFWRLPARALPRALSGVPRELHSLAAGPGVHLARLLGTAGPGFTPRALTWTRWALLAVTDSPAAPAAVRRWDRLAAASCAFTLVPLASRGSWGRPDPFGPPHPDNPDNPADNPADTPADRPAQLAVLTRARLHPRTAGQFWRAVPAIAAELADAPGLHLACGIGEAPLLLAGTFSVWSDAESVAAFAARAAHAAAVRRRSEAGWYLQECFARFRVLRVDGDPWVVGGPVREPQPAPPAGAS